MAIQKSNLPQKQKSLPIYDQLFKDVYAYVENIIDILQFILTEAELAILDLSKARLEKESFTKRTYSRSSVHYSSKQGYLIFVFLYLFCLKHKSLYQAKVPYSSVKLYDGDY